MLFVCKHIHEYLSLHTIIIYLHLRKFQSKRYERIFLSFSLTCNIFRFAKKSIFLFLKHIIQQPLNDMDVMHFLNIKCNLNKNGNEYKGKQEKLVILLYRYKSFIFCSKIIIDPSLGFFDINGFSSWLLVQCQIKMLLQIFFPLMFNIAELMLIGSLGSLLTLSFI